MKTNHLLKILLLFAIIFPAITPAQQTAASSKYNFESNGWKPVKMSKDGNSNIEKGVVFFNKAGTCNSDKVVLLKVVNLNKYAVEIHWQESPDISKTIIVPGSTEVEGKCDNADKECTESKLVLLKAKQDKDKKVKQYILSTLEISEVKN